MYKFPFPLEVGKTREGTPVLGYRHNDSFRHKGFDPYEYDATVEDLSSGLSSLSDGHYLNNLNSALNRATSAVLASVREVVSQFTGEACSRWPEDNKQHQKLAQAVAGYFASELAYQEKSGKREVSELTTRLNAVLTLSPEQCAKRLPAGVPELGASELRILITHDQERISNRLPDFGAAMRKLGWDYSFYDELEENGSLLHFYTLLKEVQKKYLDA